MGLWGFTCCWQLRFGGGKIRSCHCGFTCYCKLYCTCILKLCLAYLGEEKKEMTAKAFKPQQFHVRACMLSPGHLSHVCIRLFRGKCLVLSSLWLAAESLLNTFDLNIETGSGRSFVASNRKRVFTACCVNTPERLLWRGFQLPAVIILKLTKGQFS